MVLVFEREEIYFSTCRGEGMGTFRTYLLGVASVILMFTSTPVLGQTSEDHKKIPSGRDLTKVEADRHTIMVPPIAGTQAGISNCDFDLICEPLLSETPCGCEYCVNVVVPEIGDGCCSSLENYCNSPADCPTAACGDGC